MFVVKASDCVPLSSLAECTADITLCLGLCLNPSAALPHSIQPMFIAVAQAQHTIPIAEVMPLPTVWQLYAS